MKRREFIAGLGGAVALPLAAHAQQAERVRRIGALIGWDESDTEAKSWFDRFTQGLSELGWAEGRNLQMDVRWAGDNLDLLQNSAKQLIDLRPDAIFSVGTSATALLRETRTIPIVFAVVGDPVGAGFVANLSRPGGNLTGFISMEAAMAGKWLELLTEIAPGIERAAIMFNPDTAPGGGSVYLRQFEAAAQLLKVTPIAAPVRNDAEIVAAISSLAREPRSGLVQIPDNFMQVHSASIISSAASNGIPAIYVARFYARNGGMLSYGPDFGDTLHRAALYVDRILRGTNPADLPVQLPTKFELVVNLKTAKALGLTIPPNLLALADEVIE